MEHKMRWYSGIHVTASLIFFVASPLLSGVIMDSSLDRPTEGIAVLGSQVPGLIGTAVADEDIFVFAYRDRDWVELPCDVVERIWNSHPDTNTYIYGRGDGFFDSDDEIVFMAEEMGDRVNENVWPADVDGFRYEVEVSDPVTPSRKGWAYIYNSTTLSPVTTDYVDYSGPTTNVIDAWGYEINYGDNRKRHILADMTVKAILGGDGTDLIDRMKNRIKAQIWPFPPFYLTENDMDADLFGVYQDGQVRVTLQYYVTSFTGQSNYKLLLHFYRAHTTGESWLSTVPPPLTDILGIRSTFDYLSNHGFEQWNNGGTSGNHFFINGTMSDDFPETTPGPSWWLTSSQTKGAHMLCQDMTGVPGSEDLRLYYSDTNGSDPWTDSGDDNMEWGHSGVIIDDPPQDEGVFTTWTYLLPAGTGFGGDGFDIGEQYAGYYENPLQPGDGVLQEVGDPLYTVTILPVDPPIEIPASGGSFQYEARLENLTGSPQTIEVWTGVTLPSGFQYGPVLGPMTLTLPSGGIGPVTLTEDVPAMAPAGTYQFSGFVGDGYPNDTDQDGFSFVKLP
jgi:hypothetical protein